jgi:hypothetical protein
MTAVEMILQPDSWGQPLEVPALEGDLSLTAIAPTETSPLQFVVATKEGFEKQRFPILTIPLGTPPAEYRFASSSPLTGRDSTCEITTDLYAPDLPDTISLQVSLSAPDCKAEWDFILRVTPTMWNHPIHIPLGEHCVTVRFFPFDKYTPIGFSIRHWDPAFKEQFSCKIAIGEYHKEFTADRPFMPNT